MFTKAKSRTGETGEVGARRRSETSPWRRSRQRALYAASVDHVQGLMAWRVY